MDSLLGCLINEALIDLGMHLDLEEDVSSLLSTESNCLEDLSALYEEERFRLRPWPSSLGILVSTKLPLKYSLSSSESPISLELSDKQSSSPNITEVE